MLQKDGNSTVTAAVPTTGQEVKKGGPVEVTSLPVETTGTCKGRNDWTRVGGQEGRKILRGHHGPRTNR